MLLPIYINVDYEHVDYVYVDLILGNSLDLDQVPFWLKLRYSWKEKISLAKTFQIFVAVLSIYPEEKAYIWMLFKHVLTELCSQTWIA